MNYINTSLQYPFFPTLCVLYFCRQTIKNVNYILKEGDVDFFVYVGIRTSNLTYIMHFLTI